MRVRSFVSIWVLLLGLVFVVSACGSSEVEEDQSSQVEEATLKFAPAKSDSFKLAYEIREQLSDSESLVAEQPAFPIRRVMLFDVVDVASNGNVKLNVTLESIDILDEGFSDPGIDAMRALLVSGDSFEAIIAPNGDLLNISGFQELYDSFVENFMNSNLFEQITGMPIPQDEDPAADGETTGLDLSERLSNAVAEPIFEIFMGEETMRMLMEITFAGIPRAIQDVSDTWNDTNTLSQTLGLRLPSANRWEWLDKTGDVATIDVEFDFDPNADPQTREMAVGTFTLSNVTGAGEGTWMYNLDTGWPIQIRISHNMTASLTGTVMSSDLANAEPMPEREFSNTTEILIDQITEN